MDLNTKVAVVTGAGQGIGRAIAQRLAKAQAQVILLDIRLDAIELVAEEIYSHGGSAKPIKIDVTDGDRIRYIVQQIISEFRRIDILINNAGITGRTAPMIQLNEQDWDQVMDLNLKSVFF